MSAVVESSLGSLAPPGTAAKAPPSLSPGKRLPHPVVFKILARRRLKVKADALKAGAHPVASMLLARRYMKAAAANRKNGGEEEVARRQQQHAALQAELAWQRGTPLCFENVDRLYPDMRDVVLGNRIFRLIELTDAVHPGKVTGMILEGCDTREIYEMLHTQEAPAAAEAILSYVDEAHEVLRTWEEAQGRSGMQAQGGPTIDGGDATSEETVGEEERAAASAVEVTTGEGEPRDEWQVVQPKRRRSPSTP